MNYRKFGKTEFKVSEFGFGTAQIGGPSIIKGKPFGAKPVSDDTAFKILGMAFDAGVNFYDSSDKYGDGLAEKRLGEFFGNSADVVIATKCGFDENGERRFDRKYIKSCAEGSLKRLKREIIELFQLAKPTLEQSEKEELAETMEILKKEGKIAYAGISVGDISDGRGFLNQEIWNGLQIIYNLLTLDFKTLISEASGKNKGVIIRSPLSSGMLTGRFDESSKFDSSDDRSVFMKGELLYKRTEKVRGIKKKYDLDNEGLIVFSLNFLMSDPHVTTIIPGATSPEQMKINLKAVEQKRFSEEEHNKIFNYLLGEKNG